MVLLLLRDVRVSVDLGLYHVSRRVVPEAGHRGRRRTVNQDPKALTRMRQVAAAVERLAMASKADLFEQVFGLSVVIDEDN